MPPRSTALAHVHPATSMHPIREPRVVLGWEESALKLGQLEVEIRSGQPGAAAESEAEAKR